MILADLQPCKTFTPLKWLVTVRSTATNSYATGEGLSGTRASPERYFCGACGLVDDFGVFSES